MKLYQLIIPALLISSLNIAAQKSTNPFATNMVALTRPNEGSVNTKRSIVLPDEKDEKLTFINCWINPMDNNINSNFPEYTPVLSGNGNTMFFTSRRPGNIGNKKTIDLAYKAEDIYFATKNADGIWNPAAKVNGKINTNKNEAVTWVSADGKKMILCQNEDMFESNLVNGSWTKPEPMNLINSSYRETHASYSPDGNTLYFTTNNPAEATVGGLDICMVQRDAASGEWGEPTLVPNINSTLNEEDPTMMADGKTLYFSSQGFSSIGGYDIFKSTLQNEQEFSAPQNIGFPINTVGNEPFISFTTDGKKAFLSSDRGDQEEQNIYEVTFLDKMKIPLLVEVYDMDTKELINCNITVMDAKKGHNEIYMDNVTPGVFGADQINLGTHYIIQANAKNYEGAEVNLSTAGLPQFDPDTFKVVQKIYLKANKVNNDLQLSMVYFDYGQTGLTTKAVDRLTKIKTFLDENPTASIVINAHTDDKGSSRFNYQLADKRAKAVADWMISNGIDINRIQMKSHGEDKPVMENTNDNNRAKNRRAEIEIKF